MTTRTLDRRSRSGQIIPLAAITAGVALAAVVAFAASGGGRGDPNGNGGVGAPVGNASPPATPAPTPVVTPDPSPVVTPDPSPVAPPEPTSAPSEAPAETPHDAIPIKVDLENVSGADVYVDIVDETGFLVGAKSGHPAEGQSVAPYTLEVENLDATTLKLTWVDYPIDNALALYIFEHEGRLRLLLVQPGPTGPTDTVNLDRELILTFSEAISADQVESFLQEGLDTPG